MSLARTSGRRAAVFFDRDGTLVREVEGALSKPAQLELLAGAAQSVQRANQAGFAALVVTNQSAIARNWMTHFELERVHAGLCERLLEQGARLDAILHCPHLESGGFAPYRRVCSCRKPAPGLLLLAAERFDLDLARSWVIGDALRDLAAAAAAGARSILVRTGKGEHEAARLTELPEQARPFAICTGVLEAVELALDSAARGANQGK